MQKKFKSLVWYTKYSQKINRITQMDCKLRDESNEHNYGVIGHLIATVNLQQHVLMML